MLEKQTLTTELCAWLVKTLPRKTFTFREQFCTKLVPARVSRPFPTCDADAAQGLEGLRRTTRIYLELSVLQKEENTQKSIFAPEAQRNLDAALVSFVSGNKADLLEPYTWEALNGVRLLGYL